MKQRLATAADSGSPSALFLRWLGWMFALNVAWEHAQISLYKLPPAPFRSYTEYSSAHCLIGDMLIASVVYLGAALNAGWRWRTDAPVRGLSVLLPLAAGYTAYSEWRNVSVTGSWGMTRRCLRCSASAWRHLHNGRWFRRLRYCWCGGYCADDRACLVL